LEERETSTRKPTKPDKFQKQTNLKFALKQIEKATLTVRKIVFLFNQVKTETHKNVLYKHNEYFTTQIILSGILNIFEL